MDKQLKRRIAASATPWDDIAECDLEPAQQLVVASHRSIYAFRHEPFEGDARFFNGYARESCPRCESEKITKRGLDASGIQRYLCLDCRRTFFPQTGTIFEGRKLPLSAWTDFLLQVFSFDSFASMTREDRRSNTTLPYWMAKLFAVLEGIQSDIILSDRVWIDETYWPVATEDAVCQLDGKLPRGLSHNQICIGIGIDSSGCSIFFREGLGKTSKTKTRAAFGTHIERKSVLVHDRERSHAAIVADLELISETYDATLLKGVVDNLNPLQPVNRMCFLLKRFLGSHPGFDRNDLQGYLDLFHVVSNPPDDKMAKAAFVLDRAMQYPKTVRFREFYNVKPR